MEDVTFVKEKSRITNGEEVVRMVGADFSNNDDCIADIVINRDEDGSIKNIISLRTTKWML